MLGGGCEKCSMKCIQTELFQKHGSSGHPSCTSGRIGLGVQVLALHSSWALGVRGAKVYTAIIRWRCTFVRSVDKGWEAYQVDHNIVGQTYAIGLTVVVDWWGEHISSPAHPSGPYWGQSTSSTQPRGEWDRPDARAVLHQGQSGSRVVTKRVSLQAPSPEGSEIGPMLGRFCTRVSRAHGLWQKGYQSNDSVS